MYVEGLRHYAGFNEAADGYIANVRAIGRNRVRFGDRFILIDYGDLTSQTEQVMRRLATVLGLEFSPTLVEQTFNGMLASPNTSFKSDAERRDALPSDEINAIRTGPMTSAYDEVTSWRLQ